MLISQMVKHQGQLNPYTSEELSKPLGITTNKIKVRGEVGKLV